MSHAIAKIPPELAPELLQRAASEPAPVLVRWLVEVHHVHVTVRTVQRHLARLRRLHQARGPARAVEAAAQARELAAPEIKSDLAELGELRRRAKEYEEKAAGAGDYETALAAIREQRSALAVSIRAAGDDEMRRKIDDLEQLLGEVDEDRE